MHKIKDLTLPAKKVDEVQFENGHIYLAKHRENEETRLVFVGITAISPIGFVYTAPLDKYTPIKKVTDKVRIIVDE